MAEYANAGEGHGQARLVGGGDNIGVLDRTAWLDHRSGTCGGSFKKAVRKGEEGFRGTG